MTAVPENPFWDFSLGVYAHDGVASACLNLQDRLGVDVNLLLYCCWVGSQHGAVLDADTVGQLIDRVSDWKMRVVEPLRSVRRTLKLDLEGVPSDKRETLRTDVKQAELQAERLQQDMLVNSLTFNESKVGNGLDSRSCTRQNIDCYLAALGIKRGSAIDTDIECILDAVFR